MQESASPPASGLPATASSPSLPPVDDEKPTGKVWNGYVCPGCRSVFRVAAEFHGGDVICPSCHETLRLPKTPEERPPLTTTPVAIPGKPTKPPRGLQAAAMPTPSHQEPDESALQTMLSSPDGRIKLALAMLVPLAVVVAVLLFEPWKKSEAPALATGDLPPEPSEIIRPVMPEPEPPPPPPVAVNEMPPEPEPAPEPPPGPVPAIASVDPAPALPAPVAEIPETTPPVPATDPAPTAALAEVPADPTPVIPPPPAPLIEEEELVEAVPAEIRPAPAPASAPAVQAEVTPSPAPALEQAATPSTALVHTVVRGDTLTKIARAYQVGVAEIKKANRMRSDVIMLGQNLKIPGGIGPTPAAAAAAETPAAPAAPRYHTVVRGDTLERIARKYRVEPRSIMQANRMKNDVVQLGRKLVIPAP